MKKIIIILICFVIVGCGEERDIRININKFKQINSSNSKVTLTLISDLSCHACQVFQQEQLPYLLNNFILNGKVRFQSGVMQFTGPKSQQIARVLKVIEIEYPENYIKAYELAFADDIFRKGQLNYIETLVDVGLYKKSAAKLLDTANSAKIRKIINSTHSYIISSGIRSTPSILINGKLYNFENYESLNALLHKETS